MIPETADLIYAYDTETTGLPDWGAPSDSPEQPHLVQLAGLVYNVKTCSIVQEVNLIVRPDGWEIPEELTAIHGISQEHAEAVGIEEKLAVLTLVTLWNRLPRVAYNSNFDSRIIRIALKRYGFSDTVMDQWGEKDNVHCPMRMVQKKHGGKVKKLEESYKLVTGRDLENAHTAKADALAAAEIYAELIKEQPVECES